jgi:oligopeptide transport system substrate-binding protein
MEASMTGRKFSQLGTLTALTALLASAPLMAGKNNTLVFSMEAEIPALDPQKSNAAPSFTVGNALFECLVRIVDGKVTPGAAKSWDIAKDGKTLTFHLRDAKWSDGKPVTAQDFEYGIKRLLDPKTAAEYAFAAYYITGAEAYNLGKNPSADSVGVKALDTKTLTVQLNNATPYFLGYLGSYCFAPVRKDIIEKYGATYATAADKAVYNGPFVLKEWKNEQRKLMVKNPDYWNPSAIKLNGVEILQISDTATALSMFENGELDFVEVPSNLYKQYEQKGLAKPFYNGADDWMKVNVAPNAAKPWLANPDFRKAVAWAIDRESYCAISTKGLYTPNLRFVLPIVQGVNKKYGEEYPIEFYSPKGDAAKAKDFLKKAMADLKIDSPSKISIEYLIQDNDECRLMAETLQQQIEKNLGITVKIKLVPRKQRAQLEQQHQYDMVYSGWMPDYDDPMSYMEIWLGDSSQNNSGYASPGFDKLIKAALVEKDAKKRMGMIAQAEKTILNDSPLIPLQLRRKAILTSPSLKNLSTPLIGAQYDFVYASLKP